MGTAQPPSIRVLHLEDDPRDAELVREMLCRGGLACEVVLVQNGKDYVEALGREPFGLILCDHNIPGYDSSAALTAALDRQPDVPWIMISGFFDEEHAVDILHRGATDFVLKQHLFRLPSAATRALRDAENAREIRRMDAVKRENEGRFRRLYENAPYCVHEIGRDGRLTAMNPAGLHMLNLHDESEVRGTLLLSSVADKDRERIGQLLQRAYEGHSSEFEFETSTGKFFQSTLVPIPDERGDIVRLMGMTLDITQRKAAEADRERLEHELRQSHKLEAIGMLAGGIAHDFNNILTGIAGYTALAQEVHRGDHELQAHLSGIADASRRAADLVAQILTFSRPGDQAMAPVQWGEVVEEVVKLLKAAMPSTVAIVSTLARPLPKVLGNSTQLHQIVMNLATNAEFAMRHRNGRMEIGLAACEVDANLASTLPGLAPGSWVRLTVSDTGAGMDRETLERAFEPYFTTKVSGEGTGLGLSVLHGIVRSHHGAIRLLSEVGRGTTAEVFLPAVITAASRSDTEPRELLRGNGEHILLVDDEPMIAHVGALLLRRLGYVVQGETDALRALALLERDPLAFQLVCTDQTMPGLTGLDFASRVRALRADLPVVIVSGYSRDLTPERMEAAGVADFVQKPYTIATLAAAISRQLAARVGQPPARS